MLLPTILGVLLLAGPHLSETELNRFYRYKVEVIYPEWNESSRQFVNKSNIFQCNSWTIEERAKHVSNKFSFPVYVTEKNFIVDMQDGVHWENGQWKEFGSYNSSLGGAYSLLGKVTITDLVQRNVAWRNYNWDSITE